MKEKLHQVKSIRSIVENANDLVSQHKSNAAEITNLEQQHTKLQQELQEIVDAMDICPLIQDAFCEGCKEKIAKWNFYV